MSSRVLVVEPTEALRLPLMRALRARGVGVDAFATAREVLDSIKDAGNWSRALIELTLPDGDGATLATKVRQHAPDIDLCFVTGGADGELLVRAQSLGTILWKPLGLGPLCERFIADTRRSGVVRRVDAPGAPPIVRRG
ncbi:MAG: Two-component system transcriptional regulator [Myxococcaceae bacterium]|nr:Two-component system transcriptional regulator [Myxococcaceae bacterium]